jgi:hypothetical protein
MALGLMLGALVIVSCSSDDDDGDGGTELTASLSSDQEVFPSVPAGASFALGTATLNVNADQTQIAYRLTYQGFVNAVQQAHIHAGVSGANGPIIFFLCTNLTPPQGVPTPQACPLGSGTITGTLTAADFIATTGTVVLNNFGQAINAILLNGTYTNIHTDVFPQGEIRGQNEQ